MNRRIWTLARKDWYLNRYALIVYVALALVGAFLAATPDVTSRGLGVTLVLNVLIGTSFHIPIASILGEREKKTLAFALSLPVSPRDYAAAKVLASLAFLAVPAAAAAIAGTVVLADTSANVAAMHLVPALLGGWIAFIAALVAVVIVSESLGWSRAVHTLRNVCGWPPYTPGRIDHEGDTRRDSRPASGLPRRRGERRYPSTHRGVLRTDPELAREVEAAGAADADLRVAPRALPQDHELATLRRTKRLLRLRTWFLAGGIFFATLPGSFLFSGGELVWLMARDSRLATIVSLIAATACWAGFVALVLRLRVRGL